MVFSLHACARAQVFEADAKLRMVRFQAKQQQEAEALLQRGARGRDELELRRVNETERRMFRFRNIVMVRGWNSARAVGTLRPVDSG